MTMVNTLEMVQGFCAGFDRCRDEHKPNNPYPPWTERGKDWSTGYREGRDDRWEQIKERLRNVVGHADGGPK
jgi:ribosome modulation factor